MQNLLMEDILEQRRRLWKSGRCQLIKDTSSIQAAKWPNERHVLQISKMEDPQLVNHCDQLSMDLDFELKIMLKPPANQTVLNLSQFRSTMF